MFLFLWLYISICTRYVNRKNEKKLEKIFDKLDIILTIINKWCIVISEKEEEYDYIQAVMENSY